MCFRCGSLGRREAAAPPEQRHGIDGEKGGVGVKIFAGDGTKKREMEKRAWEERRWWLEGEFFIEHSSEKYILS